MSEWSDQDRVERSGLTVGDGFRFGLGFAAGIAAFWLLFAVLLAFGLSLLGEGLPSLP